jgi:galactoside O-acetyltransferase
MAALLRDVLFSLIEWSIVDLPGKAGRALRRAYYRLRLGSMGSGVVIDCGVRIMNPQWVHIGDNSWIDNDVIILASPANRLGRTFHRKFEVEGVREGEVHIGENCHIAPFVVLQGHGGLLIGANCTVASGAKIYSLSHHYRNLADRDDLTPYMFSSMVAPRLQSLISAPVMVGPNAAIGLNVVVLPGSFIGEGAWVGSSSVISGSVDPNTVVSVPPPAFRRQITRAVLSPADSTVQDRIQK